MILRSQKSSGVNGCAGEIPGQDLLVPLSLLGHGAGSPLAQSYAVSDSRHVKGNRFAFCPHLKIRRRKIQGSTRLLPVNSQFPICMRVT